MPTPHLRLEDTGATYELTSEVTTVGRGEGVDIVLDDPSVSRLHAELVRRGTYVYVSDLGLSTNGTRVNGRSPFSMSPALPRLRRMASNDSGGVEM